MERRDFVGAVLALFCGVALPAAVRPSLWVRMPGSVLWRADGVITPEMIEKMLRDIYQEPIMKNMVSDSELMKLFEAGAGDDRYTDSEVLWSHDIERQEVSA